MTQSLLFLASAPFEAARRLPGLAAGAPEGRLHGHGFVARARAALAPGAASFPGAESDDLAEALRAVVAPLDYADLNTRLEAPGDAALARWVRAHLAEQLAGRLAAPGVALVGVRSTPERGADLDAEGRAHLWRRYRFEAAHQLTGVPAGHPCGRMHGHGFEVVLHARATDAEDELCTHARLDAAWAPIAEALHLSCLNDIAGLENPTSEMLAAWLWRRLAPELAGLSWVTVHETATAGCQFDGVHYRIWKEQRFEAALALPRAPDGRRRLHGHSYLVRLHLTAELDEVLGWTVDYGEVKARFRPLYEQLDHHRLDALPGLAAADPGALLLWLRDSFAPRLEALDRIDLLPTPDRGALLSWGALDAALPT